MSGKAVLVTGGAKRLGAAFSQRFAEAGWHVVIHYNRSAEAAEALAAELPSAETAQCDLSDPDAGAAMVRDLAGRLDDWRCLINSASIFAPDDVTALDPRTNARSMQINAASPALLAQTFLANARSKAGRRVIQVTDQKLANLNPDFFSYTMSKAAADIAARMMAMATETGDRVYTLAPGAILPSHDQTAEEAERSHLLNLLERRTCPDEVADAALFLAEGPLAGGQSIFVDSGQHILDQDRDVIYLERKGDQP
ncbi:SDR family oxidoreductase [Aurantiacibacter gangjinensis]|uniref:Oxidoreductase n=1 Tax=Aurantiacibacter gangjinensis TaxID=502682 RepID=A0A0G9MPX1_9SPHN|nr:SDR family oxidoreductase [Aurantiacibacter gangjinensis]APE28386.1 FolM Alternative dihydrofolate reductase 1 [Aurantiacibacter gangjinensis]KLE32614.1 oxidoreductase [Aurantiacibacter gangjinensis]